MPIKDAYLCKVMFFAFIINPQNTLLLEEWLSDFLDLKPNNKYTRGLKYHEGEL